ncbi:MAG: thiamine-phosphate kinase [Balneolaceae bacterium]
MTKNNFDTIQDIGFTKLIEKFESKTGKKREDILAGIGDDASIAKVEDGNVVCTTSEIYLEGVHFDLTYTPFHHLGYKVVTAAVSDIYAMNAEPQQVLINIAIPNRYSVQMIEELYKGIDAAAKDYNVQITGGDSTASHQILAISVVAVGTALEEDIVYRSGAQKDNVICVTGDLGGALAGLRVLLREKKAWEETEGGNFQPDLEKYEYVVQRQLVPVARYDLINAFKKLNIRPTSMIDVTQGIVNELQYIGKKSNIGIEVYSPAIPISFETRNIADEMQEDVDKYAFYGGEDFEMLFTIPEETVEKLKSEIEDFTVIGKIESKEKQLSINTGEDRTIKIDLF